MASSNLPPTKKAWRTPASQLRLAVSPIICKVFKNKNARWLFGISSTINSIVLAKTWLQTCEIYYWLSRLPGCPQTEVLLALRFRTNSHSLPGVNPHGKLPKECDALGRISLDLQAGFANGQWIFETFTMKNNPQQKSPTKQTNPKKITNWTNKSQKITKLNKQIPQVSVVLCGWNFCQHNNHHREGNNVDDWGQEFLDGFGCNGWTKITVRKSTQYDMRNGIMAWNGKGSLSGIFETEKNIKKYHASIFMVLLQLGLADQLRNPEIYASPVGRTSSRQHRPQRKHTQERTCSLWQQMCGSCSYFWRKKSIAKEATWPERNS